MNHDIQFNTDGKKFQLILLSSVEIEESVELLSDTATIFLPEAVLNKALHIESKIKRGSEVVIKLGYNNKLRTEFIGYVIDVQTNNSSVQIMCEDALFLFRKTVEDKSFKTTTVLEIANYLVSQIDSSFKVICDYDLGYEKFVIYKATAHDVLKKLRDELKCNIYFNTENKELHIHAPFIEKGGVVKYSMQKNIEKSSLEYKKAINKTFEITVESIDKEGKVKTIKSGNTGGDSINIKVGSMSEADMKRVANSELSRRSFDGFEGTIDTWLLPFVKPTYSAQFEDSDYPDKKGTYYVPSVKTKFSEAGGVRTVQFGIKLANG